MGDAIPGKSQTNNYGGGNFRTPTINMTFNYKEGVWTVIFTSNLWSVVNSMEDSNIAQAKLEEISNNLNTIIKEIGEFGTVLGMTELQMFTQASVKPVKGAIEFPKQGERYLVYKNTSNSKWSLSWMQKNGSPTFTGPISGKEQIHTEKQVNKGGSLTANGSLIFLTKNGNKFKVGRVKEYFVTLIELFKVIAAAPVVPDPRTQPEGSHLNQLKPPSRNLLEIINFQKFSGDQFQRLFLQGISIYYSRDLSKISKTSKNLGHFRFDNGRIVYSHDKPKEEVIPNWEDTGVLTPGTQWLSQDKSTIFGAILEFYIGLRHLFDTLNLWPPGMLGNLNSPGVPDLDPEVFKKVVIYLLCYPLIIKPISSNHPIKSIDALEKSDDITGEKVYLCTSGGITNGKDVQHFTDYNDWKKYYKQLVNTNTKGGDEQEFFTGNLCFHLAGLVHFNEDGTQVDNPLKQTYINCYKFMLAFEQSSIQSSFKLLKMVQ